MNNTIICNFYLLSRSFQEYQSPVDEDSGKVNADCMGVDGSQFLVYVFRNILYIFNFTCANLRIFYLIMVVVEIQKLSMRYSLNNSHPIAFASQLYAMYFFQSMHILSICIE